MLGEAEKKNNKEFADFIRDLPGIASISLAAHELLAEASRRIIDLEEELDTLYQDKAGPSI